ncbi:MAG: hypothetical protein HC922_03305, partial [Leptolyngbyaceae cyanobacterium SM2_3_12]|nr:hypothetical protein [Leptolyngbyaceae cyanobacterium SM2_3_12]
MKFSLRTLLVLPFLLQVVGLTSLVGYLSYRSGQRAVDTLANRLMVESSSRINQGLERYFQTPITITEAHRTAIRLGILDWQNQALFNTYFVEQLAANPDISGLMIATEDRDFLAVGRDQPNQLVIRSRNPQTGAQESYIADLKGNPLSQQEVRTNFDPHFTPP